MIDPKVHRRALRAARSVVAGGRRGAAAAATGLALFVTPPGCGGGGAAGGPGGDATVDASLDPDALDGAVRELLDLIADSGRDRADTATARADTASPPADTASPPADTASPPADAQAPLPDAADDALALADADDDDAADAVACRESCYQPNGETCATWEDCGAQGVVICEGGLCLESDLASATALDCCMASYQQLATCPIPAGCNPWGPPAPPAWAAA